MILIKKNQIDNFIKSGAILRASLETVILALKPGVTTWSLNEIAEEEIRKRGARPSFLNYSADSSNNFPAALCVSINDEVVHGVPRRDISVRDGDVVSLDLGVEYKGMFTDMALSKVVGKCPDKSSSRLVNATEKALACAISKAKAGNRIGDISHQVEEIAKESGYDVVKQLVGHGIGSKPHLDPQVPNYGRPGQGEILVPGLAIAIEPMIVDGNPDVYTDSDGWTVKTKDQSRAAHFEKTVLIMERKTIIIT
jgi:methionyl aminopeptidase